MAYYNTYTKKYFGEFDSIPTNGTSDYYYFYIYTKGIPLGDIESLVLGASPVVHSWLNDEPKPYLQGSELELNIINIDNSTPLDSFYSEDDDGFKIELFVRIDNGTTIEDKLLFTGYLVQEDCSEEVSDIAHELKLVFTDNLGLLKNVKFADGLKQTPVIGSNIITNRTYIETALDANNVKYIKITNIIGNYIPTVGQSIILENLSVGNGVYSINKVVTNGTNRNIYVNEELPDISLSNGSIRIFDTYSNYDLVKLLDIYWICMYSCGIPLDFAFANMLNESSETPPVNNTRILEYIYINTDTFITTNDSDSLDEVINKLNYRFSSTLFQSNGKWCLVRWNELRNTGTFSPPIEPVNLLYADIYNSQFVWQSRSVITSVNEIGDGSDIEYGLIKSIDRPLKFIEHNYKYSQNDNVPFNGDLETLGDILRQYQAGTDTITEYEAIGWRDMWPPQSGWIYPPRYIRVIIDENGVEKDRYLVIERQNGVSDARRSICSEYPIEFTQGDKLKITFEFRSELNNNASGWVYAAMPGLTINPASQFDWYYVNQDGTWQDSMGDLGYYFNNDFDTFQTVSVETREIPFDGLAYIMLPIIESVSGNPIFNSLNKTYVKNIKIEYIPKISGKFNVEGHQHKTQIPPVLKNTESEEIFVDDTLKNFSKGTLFLSTNFGVIRRRTLKWRDGRISNEFKLGEIITRQEQLWRNRRRLKLEGNLFPIVKNQGSNSYNILSMLNVIEYILEANTYMIFGKLEINYRENQANFTAYEMWKLDERWYDIQFPNFIPKGVLKDPNISYVFKYLYK